MKNEPVSEAFHGLPDDHQIREMILRLPDPYLVMAWIMVETGLKLGAVTGLPVSAFSAAKKRLLVEEGDGFREIGLSDGLVSILQEFLSGLRPVFEKQGRRNIWRIRSRGVERPARYADSLLFPAWSVAGYHHAVGNLAIPASWFVTALDHAAGAVGFTGVVHSNTLRHACVRRWLDQGLGVAEVNQRLGHHDLMTTLLLVHALQHGGLSFTSAA